MMSRLFSGIWLCLRLLPRRFLRLLGMGKSKEADPPLLPTRVTVPAVTGQQQQPPVWHGVPDPATAASQEVAATWNDWTNEAKSELEKVTTREDRRAAKIDSFFSEMAPKIKKQTKRAVRPPVGSNLSAPQSALPRVEAGSRLSMGAAMGVTDLGELSDNEEDAWGDDDLDLQSIKAVERAAARRAREEKLALKRAEKGGMKEKLKARPIK